MRTSRRRTMNVLDGEWSTVIGDVVLLLRSMTRERWWRTHVHCFVFFCCLCFCLDNNETYSSQHTLLLACDLTKVSLQCSFSFCLSATPPKVHGTSPKNLSREHVDTPSENSPPPSINMPHAFHTYQVSRGENPDTCHDVEHRANCRPEIQERSLPRRLQHGAEYLGREYRGDDAVPQQCSPDRKTRRRSSLDRGSAVCKQKVHSVKPDRCGAETHHSPSEFVVREGVKVNELIYVGEHTPSAKTDSEQTDEDTQKQSYKHNIRIDVRVAALCCLQSDRHLQTNRGFRSCPSSKGAPCNLRTRPPIPSRLNVRITYASTGTFVDSIGKANLLRTTSCDVSTKNTTVFMRLGMKGLDHMLKISAHGSASSIAYCTAAMTQRLMEGQP